MDCARQQKKKEKVKVKDLLHSHSIHQKIFLPLPSSSAAKSCCKLKTKSVTTDAFTSHRPIPLDFYLKRISISRARCRFSNPCLCCCTVKIFWGFYWKYIKRRQLRTLILGNMESLWIYIWLLLVILIRW